MRTRRRFFHTVINCEKNARKHNGCFFRKQRSKIKERNDRKRPPPLGKSIKDKPRDQEKKHPHKLRSACDIGDRLGMDRMEAENASRKNGEREIAEEFHDEEKKQRGVRRIQCDVEKMKGKRRKWRSRIEDIGENNQGSIETITKKTGACAVIGGENGCKRRSVLEECILNNEALVVERESVCEGIRIERPRCYKRDTAP
jgi:hypothetical protein